MLSIIGNIFRGSLEELSSGQDIRQRRVKYEELFFSLVRQLNLFFPAAKIVCAGTSILPGTVSADNGFPSGWTMDTREKARLDIESYKMFIVRELKLVKKFGENYKKTAPFSYHNFFKGLKPDIISDFEGCIMQEKFETFALQFEATLLDFLSSEEHFT